MFEKKESKNIITWCYTRIFVLILFSVSLLVLLFFEFVSMHVDRQAEWNCDQGLLGYNTHSSAQPQPQTLQLTINAHDVRELPKSEVTICASESLSHENILQ